MVKVEFNNKTENPFYGLRNCLELFQGKAITESLLTAAYNEVKDNKEKKEMFFSLLFSIGDITNREHNIFHHNKVDNGGASNREGFYTCVNWLRHTDYVQFLTFLNAGLFNEYSCFDQLFRNRVVTTKGKTSIVKTYNMFSEARYRTDLAKYVASIVNGNNPFNKHLVAKFLTLPRLGVRHGHKHMQESTKQIMLDKCKFLMELSALVGWEYEFHGEYANFYGYRQWRKQYNQDLESVLFSTGRIAEFDEEQFIKWLDKLPAQARFRVKTRVLYSKDGDNAKWPKLALWFDHWEKFKEAKQKEQRVLEEKVRQNTASEADIAKLQKVKKEAKVTVGATSFKELYADILNGRIDKLKLESFGNKVNLPYNTLVIVDDSGSMRGAPFNFAKFLASICLVKNPDDAGRSLMGMFNSNARLLAGIDKKVDTRANSFYRSSFTKITPQPFVDPTLSLYENYQRIDSFMEAEFRSGGTNIRSIADNFAAMAKQDPQILDELQNYPIWTIISDGEWNQLYSPEASLNDFFRTCESALGYRPFIIAIDVDKYGNSTPNMDRFSGIDNFMYIPGRPEMIEQVLTNFKDMDRFDVYTPLQTLHRSNRYTPVREHTL